MRSLLPSLAATIASAAVFAACADTPTDPGPAADAGHAAHAAARRADLPAPARAAKDLAALRRATARYHRAEAALADGYLAPPPGECVQAPPGGMGYHYVNPANIDLAIEAARPEALLYEPTSDGKLRLVGAEFLVHGDAWDAVHADPPSFAGVEFDPPMDRSATAPPGPFYTLHVWIWKDNPSGMFAPFNPRVSCG
jgi:hypothetical protein